jgi:deoxyribonuclease-4
MLIGYHVSISGSIDYAVDRALSIGCTTFQIFTTNPRGWAQKKLKKEEIEKFILKRKQSGFHYVFSHMPYLPNLASPKSDIHQKSVKALIEEVKRCEQLEIPFIVTHLGSHLGKGKEIGLSNIINALNQVFNNITGSVKILLENTSGSGNSVGSDLEDLKRIIDGVEDKGRIGLCLDTCHAFAAGYDLRSTKGVIETMGKIKKLIGLNKLNLIHLNDSKGKLGSKLDRHQHIGLGEIGIDGFQNLFSYIKTKYPIILETPIDEIRTDYQNLSIAKTIMEKVLKQESLEDLKKEIIRSSTNNLQLDDFL